MKRRGPSFTLYLVLIVVATFLLTGLLPGIRTTPAVQPEQLAGPDRHIDVWDPPPVFIDSGETLAKAGWFATTECPPFLFRNGFDLGLVDGMPLPGLQTPEPVAEAPIVFVTAAGFVVQVNLHTVSIQGPLNMNSVQHWGDPHENLNGKHIKDWGGMDGWDDSHRTILLDGGAKVTMESTGAHGVVLLTSIYDGPQNVQIDNSTNTLLHHSMDPADTVAREAAQHDGETARFRVDTSTGVAWYDNIHNEDANFNVVPIPAPLGSTGGCANPHRVNDYFDDPRLPHT